MLVLKCTFAAGVWRQIRTPGNMLRQWSVLQCVAVSVVCRVCGTSHNIPRHSLKSIDGDIDPGPAQHREQCRVKEGEC